MSVVLSQGVLMPAHQPDFPLVIVLLFVLLFGFLCFEVDSYSVAQAVLQLFSGLLVLFYSFTLGEPPASAFRLGQVHLSTDRISPCSSGQPRTPRSLPAIPGLKQTQAGHSSLPMPVDSYVILARPFLSSKLWFLLPQP